MIDCHVHLYEFSEEYIASLKDFFVILAVSDDFESSLKTIEISKKFSNVVPGLGLHPWEIEKNRVEEIIKLANNLEKFFFGEIGIDKKFVPQTFEKQVETLKIFLKEAKERDVLVNLHCAGAWREALDLVLKFDLNRVIFHWYTGPFDVLEEIIEKRYFVTFNPAIFIQKKQQEILDRTPLKNILIESDGPYDYRGIFMEPKRAFDVINFISERKGIKIEELIEVLKRNVMRALGTEV